MLPRFANSRNRKIAAAGMAGQAARVCDGTRARITWKALMAPVLMSRAWRRGAVREAKIIAYIFGILLILGALTAFTYAATGRLWLFLSFVALAELTCASLLIAWAGSLRLVGAVAVVFGPVVCLCALFSIGVALLYLGQPWITLVACLAFIAMTAFFGWVIPWGWSKKRARRDRGEPPGSTPTNQTLDS
jgi:hypothetical protein